MIISHRTLKQGGKEETWSSRLVRRSKDSDLLVFELMLRTEIRHPLVRLIYRSQGALVAEEEGVSWVRLCRRVETERKVKEIRRRRYASSSFIVSRFWQKRLMTRDQDLNFSNDIRDLHSWRLTSSSSELARLTGDLSEATRENRSKSHMEDWAREDSTDWSTLRSISGNCELMY